MMTAHATDTTSAIPSIELNQQTVEMLDRLADEWLLVEAEEERLDWSDHAGGSSRLTQPVLVIGLGGTGRVIATHIKASFIEKFGVAPDNAMFLGFDSANDPVDKQESRSGRIVRLEPEGEFFLLDRVPVAGIKQHPERHQAIMKRMGSTLYRIRRPSIHNGAVQERTQGWLALAWSYAIVRRQIENRIRRLTGRSGDLRDEINRQQGINVLITGSIPGGQGSGTLLDVAYLVRQILDDLGEQADASRVLGMLVLPGAFVGVKKGNLWPNAYAFFTELEHLMKTCRFHAHYPDGTQIDSYDAPFDQVYVLDGVDEQGRAYLDHTEVCAMGAQSMALLLGSEVGQNETMVSINQRYALEPNGQAGETAGGNETYLATVGQAVLRFPARMVARRCTLRHALAMIDNILLAPVTRPQAAALRPFNGAASLQERLLSDEHDAPHRIELVQPASLDQIPPEEVPNQARTLYRHFLERRIHGDVFVQMKAKAEVLAPTLHRALAEEFAVLVARAQVPLIQRWLDTVQAGLEARLAALDADLERLGEEIDHQKAMMESTGTALDGAAGSFPFLPFAGLRRRQIRPVLAAYVDEANRTIESMVAQRATELAVETVRRLLLWVEDRRRQVQAVDVRLRQTQERLTARASELSQLGGGRHEITLADNEVVEALYQEYAGQLDVPVQAAIETSGGLLAWPQLRPDQLGTLLAQSASSAFRPVREISVEEILRRRWGERSVQQWVSRLENLAAGAWNLDRAQLPGGGSGLADFTMFGVPDENDSIFAGAGRTLVSTHDNERIVALRTIYGASFATLKAAQHWRAAYDAALGRLPLHILPQYMQEDDRSVERFALGIVFEHIYNKGNWFYFRTADTLEDDLRLGNGLERALASFAEQPELSHVVDEWVSDSIEQNGTRWALDVLDSYVSAGSQRDDELTQKLRKAARAYAAELRRNVQATSSAEG